MKVMLDLTRLLEEAKITQAEFDRLRGFAAQETGSLAINALIGFGVVAVAGGTVALVPNPLTGGVIGVLLFGLGLGIELARLQQWRILGQICMVTGALMLAAGILALELGSLGSIAVATGAMAIAAVLARSSLLMAGAVLGLSACLGAETGYGHASYSLAIYEPTLTVLGFSVLALVAYLVSKRLPSDYERLALTAARTAVLLVNFGFWIGSLWGDRLRLLREVFRDESLASGISRQSQVLSEWPFVVGWAVALLAVGLWGMRANRRWVVNVAAIFGAIHFYTQWFEKLGASPASVLLGGLLMLAFALALWAFNRRPEPVAVATA
jgi:iron complex transport system permease protein